MTNWNRLKRIVEVVRDHAIASGYCTSRYFVGREEASSKILAEMTRLEAEHPEPIIDELAWRAGYGEAIRRVYATGLMNRAADPDVLDEQRAWECVTAPVAPAKPPCATREGDEYLQPCTTCGEGVLPGEVSRFVPGTLGLLTQDAGGHSYHYLDGTSDCKHGCGCWAGPGWYGGPDGIDPMGKCPKNPVNQKADAQEKQGVELEDALGIVHTKKRR